jgi:hypothetical protein
MEVYKAIAAVQGELAKTGISKDGVNTAQNYKFRGIDQVYAALSPLLSKHGLCVIPRVIDRQMHERVTIKTWNNEKKESVLFYVTVHAEFDFVSAIDGSKHTAATYGEAMDSGDKATNKAMSAAYKYAAFMTFAIPTEGDNDADATTHEVVPPAAAPNTAPAPMIDQTQRGIIIDLAKAAEVNIMTILESYSAKNIDALTDAQGEKIIKRLTAIIDQRNIDKATKEAA